MAVEPLSDSSDFALRQLRLLLESLDGSGDAQLPPERSLSQQMGVGRRALRRALEVLEAEGRIWRRQGKGTFVGPRPPRTEMDLEALSSGTNPLEIMEARLEIEPALARLAALRATNGDIERLKHLAHKTATSADGDMDSRELWDGAFHRAIAEAAGNSLLFVFFDIMNRIRQDPTWRRLREQARSKPGQRHYVNQHGRVVAAIATRDGGAAEQAMREHLETVRASLLRIMTRPSMASHDESLNAPSADEQGRPAA
ncbi:FadR/GntR family transcriptional regulator [Microvirga thermotolerans]|uniref:FCD domain-containing protein n=1 Tax=Microvirga thermotolerans TaxID=2651334 RepID=A0A5P9JWZ7_9HYPH|nr:FCD domain-containing protein [Microvirga thermotolerans]QFU17352.1 FCD domain-containing protein [Microvirga thermotolerans]